jgi:2-C-methyl-D-erythritol 4-phosphate cytidylyltransferase / 2-C-methyl-D-erythritol 2,4-cyclodiphosphate synthase
MTAALIVAGGRGIRAATSIPKQYMPVGGMPVLARTVGVFVDHPGIKFVSVVIAASDREQYEATFPSEHPKLTPPVEGGDTRQQSVHNGLRALRRVAPARVLIHDAVRPFVSAAVVSDVISALDQQPGAISAVPLSDTLKRAGADLVVAGTAERSGLWRAQTPQGFHYDAILAAHEAAAAAGRFDLTDDAAVAELYGMSVVIVPGSEFNRKLTTRDDLAMADQSLMIAPDLRTGQGFDVHRFAPGDHVWLCGLRLDHTHALEGHSDADVALHALTDALFGAIGESDIGTVFPNSDPQWKGAPSHIFLAEAARRVRAKGGTIGNVDITIVCETPKVAPHREAMRARVAAILEIDPGRVAVKATTTEGLGFTGRREGIAALATATVVLR